MPAFGTRLSCLISFILSQNISTSYLKPSDFHI
nr:MAG TPA: hypothetical protein [Caudoviricetes sp.]